MRRVVIDNATIDRLAADRKAVERLPHLLGTVRDAAAAAGTRAGCGACRARAAREMAGIYARVKQAMTATSAQDRAALRELLGAEQLVVYLASAGGKPAAVEL